MNSINLIIAKIRDTQQIPTVMILRDEYHVFDSKGCYIDHWKSGYGRPEDKYDIARSYKGCLLTYGYWLVNLQLIDWVYVDDDGVISSGTENNVALEEYNNLINPINRKPWYWERKIAGLKTSLAQWRDDPIETNIMRAACTDMLSELERSFNINSNYFRMQKNAALEAHSIITECDALLV